MRQGKHNLALIIAYVILASLMVYAAMSLKYIPVLDPSSLNQSDYADY